MDTLLDVDHARWLLNFSGIELGVSAAGAWSVFFAAECRYLDPASGRCTVHRTAAQPQICVHYNPYSCWYRGALGDHPADEYVRIDRRRFEVIVPHLQFDDARRLTGVPTWEALQEVAATVPLEVSARRDAMAASAPSNIRQEWHDIAIGVRLEPPATVRTGAEALGTDPCDGCAAHCCETLQFAVETPTSPASIDYLRFALGFPGVSLGVGAEGWSFLVQTTCRHLIDGRCSVHGEPERPLRCQYFDAYRCSYPTLFGTARPAGFVRLELEDFDALASSITFSNDQQVETLPSADELRAAVESRWQQA